MKKTLLFLFIIAAATLSAQDSHRIDKPLRGAKTDHIPVKRLEEIRESSNGRSLTDFAVPVGKSFKEEIPLVGRGDVSIAKQLPQLSSGYWKIQYAENGTINWMWRVGSSSSQQQQSISDHDPMRTLIDLKQVLRLADPVVELKKISDERDDLGMRHTRYAQQYKGIPVWGRDLYVHSDSKGEPVIINGTYIPTPSVVSVTPTISFDSVYTLVKNDLQVRNSWQPISQTLASYFGLITVSQHVVIYPQESTSLLAYEVEIYPNIAERFTYIVDAHTGEIIRTIQRHCSIIPRDITVSLPNYDAIGYERMMKNPRTALAGFVNASGSDLNNVNTQIRMYQHTDGVFYSIWDLPNFDLGKSQMPNSLSGGAVTLSANNKDLTNNSQLFHVTSNSTTLGDKAGVSALSNMKICFDYYKTVFNRKAIDDKDGALISIIHVTEGGQGMDNAYWNGRVMLYGDGNQLFLPLAGALDVAGHEMTHGVIENTANLVYEFQPGALNESFADVFGYFIEPSSFLLGEKVMKQGHSCLRDLENPANPTGLSHQPAHMNEFRQLSANEDNGGVHQNSGITNRAAALIIKALGREKSQQIYYRALSKYMTRNSQFIDCRLACESAAKDLYPGGNELSVVQNSFAAVGIGGSSGGGGSDTISARIGGKDYVAFLSAQGRVGVVDLSTTQALVFDELATARVSSNNFKAQLTAPRNGLSLWFISDQGILTYVDNTNGLVFNFPNLKINQTGDLWNAAISPDGQLAALTSAYADDPNVYIFDGQQLTKLPILTEGGDGSAMQTVDYPDVINWSPNKNKRRLALDAFNSIDIGGFQYGFWSIYEMNFDSKRSYNLIPAQPEGIDIGNIIYGNTSNSLVTFNIVSNNVWDVIIANLNTGLFQEVGTYNGTIDGKPILDAEKPSFSPNDNYLCFSSTSNNSIVFLDGGTGQLSYLQYQFTLFNPYWFLFNGTENRVTSDKGSIFGAFLSTNITTGYFTVELRLKTNEHIKCDVVNVFGQTVANLFSGMYPSGDHSINTSVHGLAAGTYFVRVASAQETQILRLVTQK
jgi:Zn-dependent metalloprotease